MSRFLIALRHPGSKHGADHEAPEANPLKHLRQATNASSRAAPLAPARMSLSSGSWWRKAMRAKLPEAFASRTLEAREVLGLWNS